MMENKVFVFSKEEFTILAATAGIYRIYGFPIAEDMDREKAVIVMQELVTKGYLSSIDGKFLLQEPVAKLFQQIKDVKTMLDVHKRSGRKCIIYMNDAGTKISVSQRREDCFEVQMLSLDDVWKHLTEEGWIPEQRRNEL